MGAAAVVIVVVVALVLLLLIFSYNGIIRLRNRIDAAFAQIDVQLRRRHDLIPNLIESVKGYASHERETFESVTRARQQAVSATGVEPQAQAEGQLTQSLRQLLAVAEAYPDLKANQNFLALQEELTGTESRIAFSRQFYNEQVLAYDTKIQSFPGNLFARMFNFRPRQYFETEEDSRGAVQVDFGAGSSGSTDAH
jgi:LemA protein